MMGCLSFLLTSRLMSPQKMAWVRMSRRHTIAGTHPWLLKIPAQENIGTCCHRTSMPGCQVPPALFCRRYRSSCNSEVTGKTQSLMCFRNKHGEILIETPNKKVKSYYTLIGETIPASLKIKDFRRKVMRS